MSIGLASSKTPPVAALLGLAGLIPFAAAALSMWLAVPLLPPSAALTLAISYGAIILSFLGGVRWGTAIGPYDGRRQSFEFGAGVLGSLAGLASIFLPPIPGLTLLITGFLLQALWDVTSVEAGRLPLWYGKLRTLLTSGAVVALIAVLIALVVS